MKTNDSLVHVLDKSFESMSLKELIQQSPAALSGVSDNDAKLLKEAFNIKTIEDMANCKYFLWAEALVNLAKAER